MLNFWQKKNFPLCRHWPVIYRIPKWSITTQRRKTEKTQKQHAQLLAKKNFPLPLCRHWPVIYRIPKWSITTQRRKLKKQHAQLTPPPEHVGFPCAAIRYPAQVGIYGGGFVIHPSTPPGPTYLCSNVLSMHRFDRCPGTAYQCVGTCRNVSERVDKYMSTRTCWL